jgi:hypothetical protein
MLETTAWLHSHHLRSLGWCPNNRRKQNIIATWDIAYRTIL